MNSLTNLLPFVHSTGSLLETVPYQFLSTKSTKIEREKEGIKEQYCFIILSQQKNIFSCLKIYTKQILFIFIITTLFPFFRWLLLIAAGHAISVTTALLLLTTRLCPNKKTPRKQLSVWIQTIGNCSINILLIVIQYLKIKKLDKCLKGHPLGVRNLADFKNVTFGQN